MQNLTKLKIQVEAEFYAGGGKEMGEFSDNFM